MTTPGQPLQPGTTNATFVIAMAKPPPPRSPRNRTRPPGESRIKAVLGPTNTGKTHLAIERLCAHSSGAIGFPLRLLAREVYDRVCAIKGANRVALITGEERIEPKDARWLLCTAESMPMGADLAFVGLDEAQICGTPERGHVFTDRLLHARGREETMILGSATMEPMVRALVPEAEIVSRPRFSTLSHAGAKKLSRIPPRSAIVAFSAEQVYAVAEMLRRFRGGAAVVMGALSPQTRNAQVALYQSGEVDYLVATDAIGMGLNLDIDHVAFAGLSKFDGQRQRRLTHAEMAQIAGRAGRHQRDGTFGTLSGTGGHDAAFSDEEVYAIEEHRFAPLPRLFWRDAEPRCDTLDMLISDLECPPDRPELMLAPEAVDLAVLKRLAEDPDIRATIRTRGQLRRFWEACSLPDFRQQGADTHARFVARLWHELAHGPLASDHAPRAIAQLDNVAGDIDTLQGRISAIRSWAYIAQRPDWVLAREEMAERARAVEARLSDALHARLTERFVNRRTAVLMKKLGADAALLPVTLAGDTVLVDGEAIGELRGFRFQVDPAARHDDHKLLMAAAERHLPKLLTTRAEAMIAAITPDEHGRVAEAPVLVKDAVCWRGEVMARLTSSRSPVAPQLAPSQVLHSLPEPTRQKFMAALGAWLARHLKPLAPLVRLEQASTAPDGGPELRALLIRLVEKGGIIARAESGVESLDKQQRDKLRKLGIRVGALDIFHPALVQAKPLRRWQDLQPGRTGLPPCISPMPPVLPAISGGVPMGYRRLGQQFLRIDSGEFLLREAHGQRVSGKSRIFRLDPAPAVAMGLTTASYALLLRQAGFRAIMPKPLSSKQFGPAAPPLWRWLPPRTQTESPEKPRSQGAFAALARLVA